MPCRDYEYDYQTWLQRGQEHFKKLTELLLQLCRAAGTAGVDLPQAVSGWRTTPPVENAPLDKNAFDHLAQLLCQTCQTAERHSLVLPPEVAAWWAEHQARDGHAADFGEGLEHSPGVESFWEEHALRARNPASVPGVPYLDAVRALGKAGFNILSEGKRITLSNGQLILRIPREDPVNAYAMAEIIRLAGLGEKEFRELL